MRTDENVRRAFQLTNLAMAQQRSRQEHHRGGRLGDPESTDNASWRPFQIAFILTNLSGLADADHPDRDIADLLWFPTGGGKTEAYLGIIGIAILLRRLRDPKAAGVSVLMRYTLRLLTLQQYERATGLDLRAGDRAPGAPPEHGARSRSGSGSVRPRRRTTPTPLAACCRRRAGPAPATPTTTPATPSS